MKILLLMSTIWALSGLTGCGSEDPVKSPLQRKGTPNKTADKNLPQGEKADGVVKAAVSEDSSAATCNPQQKALELVRKERPNADVYLGCTNQECELPLSVPNLSYKQVYVLDSTKDGEKTLTRMSQVILNTEKCEPTKTETVLSEELPANPDCDIKTQAMKAFSLDSVPPFSLWALEKHKDDAAIGRVTLVIPVGKSFGILNATLDTKKCELTQPVNIKLLEAPETKAPEKSEGYRPAGNYPFAR